MSAILPVYLYSAIFVGLWQLINLEYNNNLM